MDPNFDRRELANERANSLLLSRRRRVRLASRLLFLFCFVERLVLDTKGRQRSKEDCSVEATTVSDSEHQSDSPFFSFFFLCLSMVRQMAKFKWFRGKFGNAIIRRRECRNAERMFPTDWRTLCMTVFAK